MISFDVGELNNGVFTNATVQEFPVDDLTSPLSMLWARCPYRASPSPSPSPQSDSDLQRDLTISFAVSGPFIIVLLLLCCTPIVWFLIWGRRRRWYKGGNGNSSDVEMNSVPESQEFSYREIDFRDLKLGRELGHGAFGRVYRGEYRGAVVAVKIFEGVQLDEAEEHTLNELRQEAEMLEKLSNHPNIVKFVGAITQGSGGPPFKLNHGFV